MTESTAGRELDALIAEKVMGWKLSKQQVSADAWDDVWRNEDNRLMAYCRKWKPSIDISAAWRVVEKLKEGYRVSIHSWGDGWQCALEIKDGKPRYPGMDIAHEGDVHAEGKIAMAISLAALKTIEATQKEKSL